MSETDVVLQEKNSELRKEIRNLKQQWGTLESKLEKANKEIAQLMHRLEESNSVKKRLKKEKKQQQKKINAMEQKLQEAEVGMNSMEKKESGEGQKVDGKMREDLKKKEEQIGGLKERIKQLEEENGELKEKMKGIEEIEKALKEQKKALAEQQKAAQTVPKEEPQISPDSSSDTEVEIGEGRLSQFDKTIFDTQVQKHYELLEGKLKKLQKNSEYGGAYQYCTLEEALKMIPIIVHHIEEHIGLWEPMQHRQQAFQESTNPTVGLLIRSHLCVALQVVLAYYLKDPKTKYALWRFMTHCSVTAPHRGKFYKSYIAISNYIQNPEQRFKSFLIKSINNQTIGNDMEYIMSKCNEEFYGGWVNHMKTEQVFNSMAHLYKLHQWAFAVFEEQEGRTTSYV